MYKNTATVYAIQDGLVKIISSDQNGKTFIKNEIIYIITKSNPHEKIMGEILKVKNNFAEAQIFEPAAGICIGDQVEQSGEMVSAALGPGLLGKIFDGLQYPLQQVAANHGYFLPRGIHYPSLDPNQEWNFKPLVSVGQTVTAGMVIGEVLEKNCVHKIYTPFYLTGNYQVTEIFQGNATVEQPIAQLQQNNSISLPINITMKQRWPVRKSLNDNFLQSGTQQRIVPHQPLLTGIRIIDSLFPIAKGGTSCIPGPFGAGKTVLQNLLAKYSNVDIVIVIACGERAGEVVETIQEFPELKDPKTGGSLMDRTIIICNTSSMPVAAREISIYMGMTLGEYYRNMGYNVLVLADSTSRWAQAMRETSGRMEEIPGDEGFPAYLDSAIRNVYERAGCIQIDNYQQGTLTLIGTVSPAGGNFEEPVTQSTLATVKTFLGLSYNRAYKRYYPAIDPLISWSRYYQSLKQWFQQELDPLWDNWHAYFTDLIKKGDSVAQMMQVTGEEGISLEDFAIYHRSKLFDICYLQQDAFDKIDINMPITRQRRTLELMYKVLNYPLSFNDKSHIYSVFSKLIAAFKNLNYSVEDSDAFFQYQQNIEDILINPENYAE